MMDKLFGLSEKSLAVTEERALLITDNIANSSTPQYKAKDIDFNQVMQNLNQNAMLQGSNSKHITSPDQIGGMPIQYRVPMQTSMDGNTVDPEIERKNFMENALHYQVSLIFIRNKADELISALKGE